MDGFWSFFTSVKRVSDRWWYRWLFDQSAVRSIYIKLSTNIYSFPLSENLFTLPLPESTRPAMKPENISQFLFSSIQSRVIRNGLPTRQTAIFHEFFPILPLPHSKMPPQRTPLGTIFGNKVRRIETNPYTRGRIVGAYIAGIKSSRIVVVGRNIQYYRIYKAPFASNILTTASCPRTEAAWSAVP